MNAYTQDIFELVLARPLVHADGDDAMQVHLWWRAPQQGSRLVQVYVNDALHDVTAWPAHREMWLLLDRTQAQRIELLAVDPALVNDVWRPQPALLKQWSPGIADVAALSLVRDEALPVGTQVTVSIDGSEVDRGPLWSSETTRSGFGALFGEGGFGTDAATGPGLGEGELGFGPLGSGGTAWRWRRDDLPAGAQAIELAVHELDGQSVLAPMTLPPHTLERLPAPAQGVRAEPGPVLRWA